MYPSVTGILMAGGKSTRMGRNKALLTLNGKTMAERGITLLTELFPTIAVNSNSPELFASLGVPVFPDLMPDAGPLSGIHAALSYVAAGKVFVLGCDIPLMTADVIRAIVEFPADNPVVIARGDGYLQPLCGLYDTRIAGTVAHMIEQRNPMNEMQQSCGLLDLTHRVATTIIPIEEVCPTYRPGTFFNMNRPEEYREILERLSRD